VPGTVRECLQERVERLNGLLRNEFSCLNFVGSAEVAGQKGLVGQPGSPVYAADLPLGDLGLWLQVSEGWSLLPNLRKLNRVTYRYAIYGDEPREGSPPLYRFEYHRFGGGRVRTTYGQSGFDHLHVDAAFGTDAHIPTHRVSLEGVLAFLTVEADSRPDAEASLVVQRTREVERELRDWILLPDTGLLALTEEDGDPGSPV
jgi:hypothetical protein